MSTAQTVRTRIRHRRLTPWQLAQEMGRLEREAENAACHLVALTGEVDRGKTICALLEDQLDASGIELSGAREDLAGVRTELAAARRDIARLEAAATAWEARYANEHPIHVPAPMDLRPDDNRPTAPHGTDVRLLRALATHGPCIPIPNAVATPVVTNLNQSADATSPTHIPDWTRRPAEVA